tara:strand:- start:13294 stop:14355 length:1062 start_codon:yes stop_codon:yes gene_type:complete
MNYKLIKINPKIKKNLIISDNITLKKTLSLINNNSDKILFIKDKKNVLIGSITDGDLRRMYYNNISTDTKLNVIKFKKPNSIININKIPKNILKKKLEYIPLVSKQNIIVEIFKVSYENQYYKNLPILIFAGGKGDRLKPITKYKPKPLITISGKALIQHIIDKFINQDYVNFYISINYKGNLIKNYILNLNYNKNYKFNFLQETKPLGTAGSIFFLKNKIENPLIVINSDIIFDFDVDDIVKHHNSNKQDVTIVTLKKIIKNPYGVISEKKRYIDDIIEKPINIFEIVVGMYVFSPKCLKELKFIKKIDMNIFIKELIAKRYKVAKYQLNSKYFIDIGTRENYDQANSFFNQ